MRLWDWLATPGSTKLANALQIGGGALAVALFVWQQMSSAGALGVILALLWALAFAMILFGVGYYLLRLVWSRGWLGAPIRNIHHGTLVATARATPSLETKVIRAADATDEAVQHAATRTMDPRLIDAGSQGQPLPTPTAVDDFRDAPHLLWSNVRVFNDEKTYRVIVRCNNVGKTAQLVPLFTWVHSTVEFPGPPIPGTDPIAAELLREDESISFQNFDSAGHIEPSGGPGPFDLNMICAEDDPIPGEREVTWRLTYMDDDMHRGFITECSARVVFVGIGSPRVVGQPSLDNTSRKERNDHYSRFMRDKKAPSTGPRRND